MERLPTPHGASGFTLLKIGGAYSPPHAISRHSASYAAIGHPAGRAISESDGGHQERPVGLMRQECRGVVDLASSQVLRTPVEIDQPSRRRCITLGCVAAPQNTRVFLVAGALPSARLDADLDRFIPTGVLTENVAVAMRRTCSAPSECVTSSERLHSCGRHRGWLRERVPFARALPCL